MSVHRSFECARCGAEPEYIPTWQVVTDLVSGARRDVCEVCYASYRTWFNTGRRARTETR